MENGTYSFEKEYFNNELKEFEMSILSDRSDMQLIYTNFIYTGNRQAYGYIQL